MYFIALRLQSPIDDYPDLVAAMQVLGPWSNRLASTWLIQSSLSARQIRDLLKPWLKPGDRLFVAEFTGNWAGTGMGAEFPDWLKRRDIRNATRSNTQ
jgi:hypothetical protein